MTEPLERLKTRLAQIQDLQSVARLLSWDQQTMMPGAGAAARGEHMATLRRLAHELLVSTETEKLLEGVRPYEDSLDPESDDAALIRVARRDHEKAAKVPAELRAEAARASAAALPVWRKAKAESDFASFLPALERNVELRLETIACFGPVDEPYDVALDDFEPEMKTDEVRRIFDRVKERVVPLLAELRERDVDDSFMHGDFPPARQEALEKELVGLLGMRPDSWRLDPTEHPFASGAAVDDVRITTNYHPDSLESVFAVIHEYGHGLYNHQLPRHLERLPHGTACSLGVHESQSRLWENMVGRSLPFWRFFYPRLQETFPEQLGGVELERFYRGANTVRPSLIRIQADEVTYGLHVILRFELEQELVHGRLALRDLPETWNARMHEYLGVEVPDDGHGVLQDVHWASGMIGYFPTYLLGTVMSVQIWEKAREELPELEEQIGRGEFRSLREWLGERVHSQGRRHVPQETLRRAIGTTIDAQPYLDYLDAKYRAGVAV